MPALGALGALAVLSCALGGCSLGFNPQRDPASVEIPAEGVEAPLKVVRHLPFVQVRLGESEPLWFLVDTGAFTTIIDDDAAARLGMKRSMRFGTHITSAGEWFGRMDLVEFESLHIGEARYGAFEGLVTDLSHLEEVIGEPFHGVIGMPLIRRGVWTLDYTGAALRLAAEEQGLEQRPGATKFMFSGEVPAIAVHVGAVELSAEIDTGSASGLDLSAEDAARVELDRSVTMRMSHLTLSGEVWEEVARAAGEVRIGPYVLDRPFVNLARETMLGGEVLARGSLTIDAARQILVLQPAEEKDETITGAGDGAEPQ